MTALPAVFLPSRDAERGWLGGPALRPEDGFGRGVGIWASPLYVREQSRGLDVPGTGRKTGTSANLMGGMWGIDLNRDAMRLGLTLGYGRTNSDVRRKSLMGDFSGRYRNDLLNASLRAEYSFDGGRLGSFVPHVGVKYLRLNQPSSTPRFAGQTVVRTSSASLQQIRLPAGFSWTRPFHLDSGLKITPEIHAALLPCFGDSRLQPTVSLDGLVGHGQAERSGPGQKCRARGACPGGAGRQAQPELRLRRPAIPRPHAARRHGRFALVVLNQASDDNHGAGKAGLTGPATGGLWPTPVIRALFPFPARASAGFFILIVQSTYTIRTCFFE